MVDANDDLVQLTAGTLLRDSNGAQFAFDGTAVTLPQMQVIFTFQPFVWSDGTAVTAADSVFSFEIAADPATPVNKQRIRRTASYIAVDAHSVQWTGVPGNVNDNYVENVWTPLPKHQLGSYTAAELLTLDMTTQTPLSYGRFMVESWIPGSHITLISNPHYYAKQQNAPTERLIYEFLQSEDTG